MNTYTNKIILENNEGINKLLNVIREECINITNIKIYSFYTVKVLEFQVSESHLLKISDVLIKFKDLSFIENIDGKKSNWEIISNLNTKAINIIYYVENEFFLRKIWGIPRYFKMSIIGIDESRKKIDEIIELLEEINDKANENTITFNEEMDAIIIMDKKRNADIAGKLLLCSNYINILVREDLLIEFYYKFKKITKTLEIKCFCYIEFDNYSDEEANQVTFPDGKVEIYN